tara:strand:- start:205 stop:1677 length:1473 start_codon:yes stop_codon:yes gene_type:complete
MKLIRLSSQDNNVFSNNIQNSLILPKQSQVALLNMNFEKEKNQIVINNSNNEIDMDIGNFNAEVVLDDNTINEDNISTLFGNLDEAFNEALDVDFPQNVGLSFDWDTTSDEKSRLKTYQTFLIDQYARFTNIGTDSPSAGVYHKNSNTTENTADAAFYGDDDKGLQFFHPDDGCGVFRITINELNNTSNGFYIGLGVKDGDDMAGDYTFNTSNITFGIYAQNTATNYKYITPNQGLITSALAIENATLAGNDNDVLCIVTSQGKMEGRIYSDSNPNGEILFQEDYTSSSELYPIVGFYSKNNTSIRRFRYTKKATRDSDRDSFEEGNPIFALEAQEGTPQPPVQDDDTAIDFNITFQSEELSDFLGFNNVRQEDTNVFPSQIRLLSQNVVNYFDRSEAYIVEMMNLKLDSFDGLKEERKSILMLVQNSRDRDQPDVLHEANTPIFIDLNNDYEIPLRNIDVRVVDDNYNKINIDGRANMTLLFKSKDESL